MGIAGWLRWGWRQLTSMRTALILLFFLALASIPGSLFPQRSINQAKVIAYFENQPTTAKWLDRLGLFDVFTSPWFAAIYLLLFISLIGCVLPRAWHHLRGVRQPPPPAPSRLERLPFARTFTLPPQPHEGSLTSDRAKEGSPHAVLDAAEAELRRRRFRVVRGADGSLAAEKGYARETGNLVFHLALVVMLIGVAVGSLYGYRGNVVVREGAGFSNTLTQYDSFRPGRAFSESSLSPFSFTLQDFMVAFEPQGTQRGAPREFEATVTYTEAPGEPEQLQRVAVNSPLRINGTKVFLIGWGYAPQFTVRDGEGTVVLQDSVPFLPQNGNFASTGVVKSPDAQPTQLGFQGVFLPTTQLDPEFGPISVFPAAVAPSVFLTAWTGDLGLDSGTPQSVYQLDVENMEQAGAKQLAVGETWTLANGAGSITFDGVAQFATFSVARDPGSTIALVSAVAAMIGLILSLFVRRRRLWVRAVETSEGHTVVRVAGLARTENGDPGQDLDALIDTLGLTSGAADAPDDDGGADDRPPAVEVPQ